MAIWAGTALCMLASTARAADIGGGYTYKLVLRNDLGFALSGTETPDGDERVSNNYKIEVYNAEGAKVDAKVEDAVLGSGSVGYNCTLSVPVGDGAGYARAGEQLTLVVTTKYDESERFRSSKVLPPVGGKFGFAKVPVGVFHADPGDTDYGWDVWRIAVGYAIADGDDASSIGGPDDDFDGDGLSNMREYQLGTDPAGGALPSLMDRPRFSIEDVEGQDGVCKVSFGFDPGHIYSIRAIEGAATAGKDGLDLSLYESLDSLANDSPWGTYVYEAEDGGTKEFFVKKPSLEACSISLAVDGRFQAMSPDQPSSSVTVTPGYPIEYATEAAANAAKAIALVAPVEAVQGVLTGDGMADGYKAKFTVEVRQADEKWLLVAQLTPEAQTNLMDSATAATRQLPVAEIAALPAGATMNVVLTGCTPGFYYSLCSGATVADIAADAEKENLGVLCDAGGKVVFPKAAKPEEGAGFFKVVASEK